MDEGGEISRSADFMQICFDPEVIVEITAGYDSSINRKVECNHQTINNTVHIQRLYRDTTMTYGVSVIKIPSG